MAGAALDAARLLVTQYLGQQPHIMKASGVPESLLEDISKVLTWPATAEEVEAASKLVPDDVVQMITASGTAAECKEKVAEYVHRGCTCPILYPLGADVHAVADLVYAKQSFGKVRWVLAGQLEEPFSPRLKDAPRAFPPARGPAPAPRTGRRASRRRLLRRPRRPLRPRAAARLG